MPVRQRIETVKVTIGLKCLQPGNGAEGVITC